MRKSSTPGIFCIEHIDSGKKFIGYSNRGKWYRSSLYGELNKGVFKNWKLQEDWDKYGEEEFEFLILEEIEFGWIERKQYYMDFFKVCETGYNIRPKADLSELADETKTKKSLAQLGKKNHQYGKSLSKKEKEKRSKMFSGKGNPRYGKKLSKETKEQIRAKAIGRKMSPETKRKISESMKGKVMLEDQKDHLRKKALERWKNPVFREKMQRVFKKRGV